MAKGKSEKAIPHKDRPLPLGWKVPWRPFAESTVRAAIARAKKQNVWEAYEAKISEVMREYSCTKPEAIPEALRRMNLVDTHAQMAAKGNEARLAFDRAFRELPNAVSARVEWEWIASHPAIMRLERTNPGSSGKKGAAKPIRLNLKDITEAPNGPAPSKRAVTQLQNLANSPKDFLKQLTRAHQKMQEEGADEKAAAKDPGIEEVERLFFEFTGKYYGV